MVNRKDFFHLHFIVLIWGFTAILGKLLDIPAVETVLYRTLLAFIGLSIVMTVRGRSLSIDKKGFFEILFVGISISAHWILFFAAAKVSNVSIALAGMSTATLWTAILEPMMLHKRPSKVDVGFGLVIIVGLYIIFRFEFNHALGLTMAVSSAVLSAFFSIRNYTLIKRFNHMSITVIEMLGAFLATLAFLPFYSIYFSKTGSIAWIPSAIDWLWLILLSQLCTVYAFTASTEIMKRVSAFMVNLTINLEPIYGILLAYIIFGDSEKMSGGFYAGGLIILIAVLCYPMVNRWKMKSA